MQKIIIVILLLFGLAGMALGIYASQDPKAVIGFIEDIGVKEITSFVPFIFIVIIFLIMGAAFSPLLKGSRENAKKKKLLKERGQRKTTKVISVEDTGITVNNNPYVKITVETTSGTQATFQQMVPRIKIPRPGDTIEILYDPSDPTMAMPAPPMTPTTPR